MVTEAIISMYSGENRQHWKDTWQVTELLFKYNKKVIKKKEKSVKKRKI